MNRFLPRGIMSRLLKLFLAQIFALADSTVFAGGCGSTVSAGFGGSMVFSSCGGLTVLMGWGSTVLTICSRFAGFLFENCCSVGVVRLQVVLCQIIKVFYHQLIQNSTTTDFVRFCEDLHQLLWNSKHMFCKVWISEQLV